MSSTVTVVNIKNATENGRSTIYSMCEYKLKLNLGIFVMLFGQEDKKETRTDGRKARRGETWELGINMGKSYWG